MKQYQLLSDLKEKVNKCHSVAKQFQNLPVEKLTYSPNEKAWNILQCLEHCNRYWDFYKQEFDRHLGQGKSRHQQEEFDPGFWGKKFNKMMLPENGKIMKMKAFKSKSPSAIEATTKSLDMYVLQQEELLAILEKAETLNLNQHRCNLTIPLVKMNYGATLQFIINHNVRHLIQAQHLVQH